MDEKYPYLVEVKLIEQIQPVARGSRYEDPLAQSLEEVDWALFRVAVRC